MLCCKPLLSLREGGTIRNGSYRYSLSDAAGSYGQPVLHLLSVQWCLGNSRNSDKAKTKDEGFTPRDGHHINCLIASLWLDTLYFALNPQPKQLSWLTGRAVTSSTPRKEQFIHGWSAPRPSQPYQLGSFASRLECCESKRFWFNLASRSSFHGSSRRNDPKPVGCGPCKLSTIPKHVGKCCFNGFPIVMSAEKKMEHTV